MRIDNVSLFTDAEIRAAILFVRPPGVAGETVRVAAARWPYNGRAHPHENRVLVRIGPRGCFPSRGGWTKRGKGYLPAPRLANRMEALVYVLAHELRHLWQYRVPRGRRVWGARGQYSERDADAYALGKLRAWRRHVPSTPIAERLAAFKAARAAQAAIAAAPPPIVTAAPVPVPKVKSVPTALDRQLARLAHTDAALKRWTTKARRAETALRKLRRQRRAIERAIEKAKAASTPTSGVDSSMPGPSESMAA
jgi:hypothetical protein